MTMRGIRSENLTTEAASLYPSHVHTVVFLILFGRFFDEVVGSF